MLPNIFDKYAKSIFIQGLPFVTEQFPKVNNLLGNFIKKRVLIFL